MYIFYYLNSRSLKKISILFFCHTFFSDLYNLYYWLQLNLILCVMLLYSQQILMSPRFLWQICALLLRVSGLQHNSNQTESAGRRIIVANCNLARRGCKEPHGQTFSAKTLISHIHVCSLITSIARAYYC